MTVALERAPDRLDVAKGAVCHLYDRDGTAPISLCGVPRSEQPAHDVRGSQAAARCDGCGLKRCTACCARASSRNYGYRSG